MATDVRKNLTLRDALHFQLLDAESVKELYGISKSTYYRVKKESEKYIKANYGIDKSNLDKQIKK